MAWYAPHGENLKGNSVNESGINTFTDSVVESLVRETIQNSLDVVVDTSRPLKMTFNLKKLQSKNIPSIDFFLETAVPKAKKRWKHDKAAIKYLNAFERRLNENYISILKISDYNTTGLEKPQWDALIRDVGSSYKRDEGAGGSYGIGKSAPFAASHLRMLFYETRLDDGSQKSIGVTNFLSYELEKYINGEYIKFTTEGPHYLGEKERNPQLYFQYFGFPKRVETGTDIFVIGFNREENWENEIIKFAIKNFMVSIHDEKIVLEIGNKIVNKESLSKYFDTFSQDEEIKRTKKYYDVYNNPHSIKIGLDETFEKYGFKNEDAYLLIAEAEDATRRVLMTRGSGMQIYEQSRISALVQFNANFRAVGMNINSILREMENPRHDKWVPELLEEQHKLKYKDLILDLGRFFRKVVKEEFQIIEGLTVDAYGVSDFLPLDSDQGLKDNETSETVFDVILKERKPKLTRAGHPDNESDKIDWAQGGLGGNIIGEDYLPKNQENNSGIPNSNVDLSNKGDKFANRTFKEIKNDTFSYRIIEKDYNKGIYTLMLKSKLDRDLVKIETKTVTESSETYETKLVKAFLNEIEISNGNDIFIENLKINEIYYIYVQIEEDKRVKLEARVYESKE